MKALRLVMRYLNVAEKNDAAKHIAGHLSKGTARRREGLSTYNKIYEFEADVLGQRSNMVMTSVSGHLLGYEFVGAYKSWQSCNPLSLFEAPVAKTCPEDYQKIKQTLIREIQSCHGLIIWTDCDREGENIGFEIIQVCNEVKKNLKIFRAKFSEITALSVSRALQTLEAPNKNISDAVDVRQELDLRIGASFTRFQTLRLQKVFPEKLANSLVSYGSCQFPTLGFVVERYRAVETFVPESFWKISVVHTMNDLKVEFNWKRTRLFDEQACMVIHDICNENPTASVQTVKSKPKSKWRPLPLDTIEMEKLSSRKLRINAKEAMKIAEKLYTQGIISYPRTETNIYPKELNLNNLISLHTENHDWGPFAQRILDTGGANPRQGKKSDQAHPPIHPTKYVDNLSGNEKKIYELVVRSFLACCSKDAIGHETTVNIDIATEKFSANGLMILERNYLDVYPYDKWSGKEIHIYHEGDTFIPTSLDMVMGQTSAPALLTEADLIALMDKHGIGTDATHADHIETIKNRSYVALADNIHFVPGLLGMGLVEGYDSMGLSFSKPDLRAGLEADLKEVCEGRKLPQEVLSQQIATYRDVFVKVSQEAQKIDDALGERFNQQPQTNLSSTPVFKTVMKCSKCKSDMILRTKKDNQGYFISCMGYPSCKNAIWLPPFVDSVSVMDETCETCGPSFFKLQFQWKNRSLNHIYPPPFVNCIGGCDVHFLQTLNINIPSQSTQISTHGVTIQDSGLGESMGRTQSNLNHQINTNSTNWFTNDINTQRNIGQNNNSNSGVSNADTFRQRDQRRPTNDDGNRKLNQNIDDDNHVVCNCGDPAILLTVRKASPNLGRQFYKCQKPKENNGCNFFLWATSEESSRENSINSQITNSNITPHNSNNDIPWGTAGSSSSTTRNDTWNTIQSNEPKCRCNLSAKRLTVHKEGANKGRIFYACPNQSGNKCDFFEWASNDLNGSEFETPSTSWGSTANNGRGRASQRGARAPTARGRKRCGNCREEGHMRNKCPKLQ